MSDSPDDEVSGLDEFCIRIVMDLEEVTELIRGDLNYIHRRILVALVTQDVHYRDIV
jgi:dynein heavy chain